MLTQSHDHQTPHSPESVWARWGRQERASPTAVDDRPTADAAEQVGASESPYVRAGKVAALAALWVVGAVMLVGAVILVSPPPIEPVDERNPPAASDAADAAPRFWGPFRP